MNPPYLWTVAVETMVSTRIYFIKTKNTRRPRVPQIVKALGLRDSIGIVAIKMLDIDKVVAI